MPDILRVIQLVVAPVFLLTAVGTLINALNSRLGRAVDRRRALEQKLRKLAEEEALAAREELERIGERINVVYLSIFTAVICARRSPMARSGILTFMRMMSTRSWFTTPARAYFTIGIWRPSE